MDNGRAGSLGMVEDPDYEEDEEDENEEEDEDEDDDEEDDGGETWYVGRGRNRSRIPSKA